MSSDRSTELPSPGAATVPPSLVRPPTLGGYLRAARRERKLSRDQVAVAAAVSTSYVTQLETGEKSHPSVPALRAITTALGLDARQLRHAYNLARLRPDELDNPAGTPGVEELIPGITPEMLMTIDYLNPTLAAYVDERWDILAANESYARAFPGLIESGNVMRWFFASPSAKKVTIEWETEAALTVHWFRGLLGSRGHDKWGTELLDELSKYPDFARLWLEEQVKFGRDTSYMHLRDPGTGEPYTLNVQLYATMPEARVRVQVYIGLRIPYSGPVPPAA